MKPVNITSYLQRPVDNAKEPIRTPMTEWEYEEIHAGERPRTGNSSSDSDLYEFSVGSEYSSDDSDKDDLMSICHPPSYNEPDLLKLDPNEIGKSLQGDLDFIASSHFENEKRIKKNKDTSKAVMSTFKYTYFEDFTSGDDDDAKTNSAQNKSTKSNSPSNKSKKSKSKQVSETTDLLKSSTASPEVSFKNDIAKRTSQLREKKSPKKTQTDDFSEDSDVELLKSSSSTIKNSKLPFKKEICETTSKFRENRKPKPQQPSDDEYYLDKENTNLRTDDLHISDNDTLENSIHTTDFFRTETMEMTKKESEAASSEHKNHNNIEHNKTEDVKQDTQEEDIQLDTKEDDSKTNQIENDIKQASEKQNTEAAVEKLNQMTNNESTKANKQNSNKISPESKLKKPAKSPIQKSEVNENESKYEANPPSMFAKYMEEHPPPPKPKNDTPTRFRYKPKPLANEAPKMFNDNPPQPPPKVHRKKSPKIRYNPNEIPDQPPSFYNNPSRIKKRKALTDEEREIRELKRQAEVKERVKYDSKKFDEIERIRPSNQLNDSPPKKERKPQPNTNTPTSATKKSKGESELNNKDKKVDKGNSQDKQKQEYSYKNKRNWKEKGDLMKKREKYMKKKQLVQYIQEKLLTKEDRDLVRRKEILVLNPHQELHRLIKISDEREKEAKRLEKKKAAFAKKVQLDSDQDEKSIPIENIEKVETKPVKTPDNQTTKKEKDKSHFINKVDKSLCAAEIEAKLAKMENT